MIATINNVPSYLSVSLVGEFSQAQREWTAFAPQCLRLQLEASKARSQIHLKTLSLTHSHVWRCCWPSAKTLAELMAGHPHRWTLHAAWASSQHGGEIPQANILQESSQSWDLLWASRRRHMTSVDIPTPFIRGLTVPTHPDSTGRNTEPTSPREEWQSSSKNNMWAGINILPWLALRNPVGHRREILQTEWRWS